MRQKQVPTYNIHMVSSRIEKYIILILYFFLILIILTLPPLWCWPLLITLTLNLFFLLNKRQKYTYLTTQQDGSLLLEDRHGHTCNVGVLGRESTVYPFLIILHVQHDYRERILLWSDSTDTTTLRHLRIWLYWYWPTTSVQ